jgi:hypothetical protein
MNENQAQAKALSEIQADWIKEHEETFGQHFDLVGPGTSSWNNCIICNPPPSLSDIRRQDLEDEIEFGMF